ncbi:MAG: chromate transporter [Synechococcaceae cyanobacterium]|nr:chromate transporter [Synechococcaceae cyanobacterium]
MPAFWFLTLASTASAAAPAAHCHPEQLNHLQVFWQVVSTFLSLSLFSLGGGNTLLNEYHQIVVDRFCWLSSTQFADLYALAEAAPGPSSMIVGLMGMGAAWRDGPLWSVLMGVSAEVAILLPSTVLMTFACLSWNRLRDSPWRYAFERGFGPITLGILFAVGVKIIRVSDHGPLAVLVSLLVCLLMLRTRLSPLWFMAVSGVLGALGLINR